MNSQWTCVYTSQTNISMDIGRYQELLQAEDLLATDNYWDRYVGKQVTQEGRWICE